MAGQQWVRLNLASSVFPFITEFDGRSIIQPGLDQNYNYIDQIGEPVKDRGIPQAIYMHNVMPTSQGYQAVGYDFIPSSNNTSVGAVTTFDSCFETSTAQGSTGGAPVIQLYSPNNLNTSNNDFFFTTVNAVISAPWRPLNNPRSQNGVLALVTIALIDGDTYICKASSSYSITDSLIYKVAFGSIAPVTLLGVVANLVRGICSSNGYMIIWDSNNNILWSNQTNPIDFVPDIATGAGGGSVQQIRGVVLYCLPITGGFIIYCSENMVGATYTGNSQFPFSFQEIVGSSGIGVTAAAGNSLNSNLANNLNSVAYQNNLSYHYAYTASGIQQVNLKEAVGIFPEVSDFLAKRVFEDFDETNNVLVETAINKNVPVKLCSIASRYFIISYAATPVSIIPAAVQGYTHALVFDSVLSRWGKLKIPHVSVIQLSCEINSELGVWRATDSPIRNMGFLQSNGSLYTLNMDIDSPTPTIPVDGVLIFGKVQSSRNKFIAHQRTDIENVNQGDTFSAYIIPSFDGKTLQAAQIMSNPPNLIINAPKMKRMALRVSCQNFLYLFKGAFNLVSLLLDYTQEGHR